MPVPAAQVHPRLAIHQLPKMQWSTKSDDASIGFCPCCKTTLEDHNHVLRCPSQASTRYLALQDIRSSIEQTTSPVGPVLWAGLAHWLNHLNEPLSIDTSQYSGNTQLLVQQARHEQERISWDKAFRGYLSLTWGLLGKTHDVPNSYNKNPQPSQCMVDFNTQQSWKLQQGHVERPLHKTP